MYVQWSVKDDVSTYKIHKHPLTLLSVDIEAIFTVLLPSSRPEPFKITGPKSNEKINKY